MRLSKTLLISAALAAFMAVAVAQDATDSNSSTSLAAPTTSTDASDAIFFADDDDGSDDPALTPDTAVDGDDNGDDDDADGEEDDSSAVAGANDDGNTEEDGDDNEEQQTASLVKRASAVPRKTLAVDSEKNFCLLLPPKEGGDVAKSEEGAVSYCTNPHTGTTPGARKFPKGFIKTAHLRRNRGAHAYVQITGRIDRTKYKLRKSDQGGQNDIKSTKGSSCVGYSHFVQLIEPNDNIYCIRCCMRKEDCPTNKSTKGCRDIIRNGEYN